MKKNKTHNNIEGKAAISIRIKAITQSIKLSFRLKDISYVRITKLMIDAGWIGDSQLRLEQYIKEKELLRSAKLLLDKKNGVVTLT